MAEVHSLLEFLQQLSLDDGLRAAFTTDPQATLAEHGLEGLTAEDVHDAAVLVADTRTVDFDLDHPLAPDPVAGFLDAFLPGDPLYVPADLGETVTPDELVGDLPGDEPHDVPEHDGGFGTGHTTAHGDGGHLAADGVATEQHTAVLDGYDEQYAGLDEHGEPDLDDLFVAHADPAPDTQHHPVGEAPTH